MFVDVGPAIDYHDPWDQPFGQRLEALCRRPATCRVAYYYEKADTSTFRYRIYNMIQVVAAEAPDMAASWFCEADVTYLDDIVDLADIIVICRSRYSDRLNRMITRARNLGRRVIFDIDDLVFDLRYVHLILQTLDQVVDHAAFDHWYAYVGRMGETMRLCDRVIVTNDFLAERVRDREPGKDVRIIPNFLNREQIGVSAAVSEAKSRSGFRRDERIHIGYFSGTPTHNRDFALVADALAALMERDRRLVLRLVGFMDVQDPLTPFKHRIDRHRLQDFLNLQRLIGETELNIVPLQDNIFTNCKSELKFFEAAVVGGITIASPTYTYRGAVTDGVTGHLAQAHQWEEKLGQAIERVGHADDMIDRARRGSLDRFGWDRQFAAIRAALFD